LQQEWHWPEKYSAQPDVLRYVNWVADRLELRGDIQLQSKVTGAHYDEHADEWAIEIERRGGGVERVRAQYFVLASGFLSVPNLPDIPGLGDFKGTIAHTARWPENVELAGKRVGVVGTAASGVQVVQTVAESVSQLTVFQRTANWSFPLRNVPMSEQYETWIKKNYDAIRHQEYENRGPGAVLVGNKISVSQQRSAHDVSPEEREADFEARWRDGGPHMARSFTDIVTDIEANNYIRDFWTRKIAEIVEDPETARKLTPRHPPLTRRPPGNTAYYETFNRENVELVDIKEDPIERVTATGVRLESGVDYELDVLVLATGFDAGGGAAMQIDLRGRGGVSIADHWRLGVRTNLGMMVDGFPNLLLVHGPQSPAIHFSPMLLCIYQAEYFSRLIQASRAQNVAIEATAEEEEFWTEEVRRLYDATLIPQTDSWWMGANVPGKPRRPLAYAGGFLAYRKHAEAWFAEFEQLGAEVEIAAYGI
jgi:cyclohexanone monooxygenase